MSAYPRREKPPLFGCPTGSCFSAYEVIRPLKSVGAEPGDVLIYRHYRDRQPILFGEVTELGCEDYASLIDNLRRVPFRMESPLRPESYLREVRGGFADLFGFLTDRRHWGQRCKVFFSHLLMVKARDQGVTIQADGDEEAIAQLLRDVGCTLPS